MVPEDAETAVSQLNKAPKIFFETKTTLQQVQLEKLDAEVDTYKLYNIKEEPIFVDTFLVSFPPKNNMLDGLDPSFIGISTNFHVQQHQILGLLHNKTTSLDTMSEVIEDHTRKIVEGIQINDIAWFQQDWRYKYKKVRRLGLLSGGMIRIRKRPYELYKYRLNPFEKFILTHPVYGHPKYNPLQKNEYLPKSKKMSI